MGELCVSPTRWCCHNEISDKLSGMCARWRARSCGFLSFSELACSDLAQTWCLVFWGRGERESRQARWQVSMLGTELKVKGREMTGGPPTIDEVRPLILPGIFWRWRPALKRWICRETAAVSVEKLIGPYLAVPFIFIFYQLLSIICVLGWIWELILFG